MKIKGIITEDLVNYKKPCMTIMMPSCDFKCGADLCQNSPLALIPAQEVTDNYIISLYAANDIASALCFQGLEPFDSWEELFNLISKIRNHKYYSLNDDIVIYTGYTEDEISDKVNKLKQFPNIVIKFGRYIPNQESHFDEVLGIKLASDNQYAIKIS